MCRGVAIAVGAPRAAPPVACRLLFIIYYLSIRSEDANATRILWKHATIATAKIGIVTLEISEAAAGARGSPLPSPISANLSQLTSARGSPSPLPISAIL